MSRELFYKICSELAALDCAFTRYCLPSDWGLGYSREWAAFKSERVIGQFRQVHELVAAIQAGDKQKIGEWWHILSDGQICPEFAPLRPPEPPRPSAAEQARALALAAAKWRHLPTKTIRVPAEFADRLLELAREWDATD